MPTQVTEAIGVMRALSRYYADKPDDYPLLGLPNISLTVGHCRTLADAAEHAANRDEWAKLVRKLGQSSGDAERYAAEQDIIAFARDCSRPEA